MRKDKALQIIAENKKSYNIIAHDFDIARQTAWPEFEMLASYIKEGSRVLDIGCGNGRLYKYLNNELGIMNYGYAGIDQSEELIKIARKNYPEADFRTADVFDLPYKNGEFDIAAGIAFLHHIPSQELRVKCLKEIYRILKPGGILFLTNWNLWQWKMIKKYKLRFFYFFFPRNNLDAGDFWIPFRSPCHPRRRSDSGGNIRGSRNIGLDSRLRGNDSGVLRFYHHFSKKEIVKLCRDTGFKNIKYEIGKTERNGVVIARK